MIEIGLFVNSVQAIDTLINIFEDKIGIPPYLRSSKQGYAEYYLPLLHITIISVEFTRGRKYDLIYYDEENISNETMDIMSTCCPYSRPRPLKYFLDYKASL